MTTMKRAVRAAFAAAGQVNAVWHVYKLLNMLARILAEPLHQADRARCSASAAADALRLSPDLTVLNGPFAGMRYTEARSAGSTLVPKILGSYERELQPLIEKSLAAGYSDVVDVGCAEGYYAVGLAMRLPSARVHAFDTDAEARRLCHALAAANGVDDRLDLRALCDEATLLALPLGPRALVISDCEGYEDALFTAPVAACLARHDVLIEVHDLADASLGGRLRERFAPTHDHVVIDSVDDVRKPRTYAFAELDCFDVATRRRLLSEGRGMVMEWLFFTPRKAPYKPSLRSRRAMSIA